MSGLRLGWLAAICALLSLGTARVEAGTAYQRAFLQLAVNGMEGNIVLVRSRGPDMYVREEDLRQAGLPLAGAAREIIDGEAFVPLSSLAPTVTYTYDARELALRLRVDPKLLPPTIVTVSQPRPASVDYLESPSAFVNYSLSTRQFGEPTLFSEQGGGIHGIFFDDSLMRDPLTGRVSRISTRVSVDDREHLTRLDFGDSSADAGNLGGLPQLGGIGLSRNFSIDPYVTTYPGQSLSGTVSTPSIADIYVNGVLSRQLQLPPGPFSLESLPITAGGGATRVVIQDAFGRQQVIGAPYYLSTQSLRSGLQQFSYELGFVRSSEIGAGAYGPPAFVAHHRYGWSDAFTPGAFLESDGRVYAGGPEATFGLPIGQLQIFTAASRGTGRTGWAGSASYSFITQNLTLGAAYTANSRHYETLTLHDSDDRALRRTDVFVSHPVGPVSVIGQWTCAEYRDGGRMSDATLSATLRTSDRTSIALSLSSSLLGDRPADAGVFLAFNATLGPMTTATLSSGRDARGATETLEAQKSLPLGEGFGYLVQAQAGADPVQQADLQYQGTYGRYDLNYSQVNGVGATTLAVSGALVAIGGELRATRPLDDAYALVRVPGVANVAAYLAHQPTGHTDADGDLLVPNLISNYGNQLSIDDQDIPLEYTIDATERTVAPPYRGGVVIDFPVRPLRGVTGLLRLESQGVRTIPAYGELSVELDSGALVSPIGNGGEFYLEGVPAGGHAATIRYQDRECHFNLVAPPVTKAVAALGTLTCRTP